MIERLFLRSSLVMEIIKLTFNQGKRPCSDCPDNFQINFILREEMGFLWRVYRPLRALLFSERVNPSVAPLGTVCNLINSPN